MIFIVFPTENPTENPVDLLRAAIGPASLRAARCCWCGPLRGGASRRWTWGSGRVLHRVSFGKLTKNRTMANHHVYVWFMYVYIYIYMHIYAYIYILYIHMQIYIYIYTYMPLADPLVNRCISMEKSSCEYTRKTHYKCLYGNVQQLYQITKGYSICLYIISYKCVVSLSSIYFSKLLSSQRSQRAYLEAWDWWLRFLPPLWKRLEDESQLGWWNSQLNGQICNMFQSPPTCILLVQNSFDRFAFSLDWPKRKTSGNHLFTPQRP